MAERNPDQIQIPDFDSSFVPVGTPTPEDDIDRLADQGFNYTEIRLKLGHTGMEDVVTAPQTSVPAPAAESSTPRRSTKKLDRRHLSPIGKMIADEPPEHIRRQRHGY